MRSTFSSLELGKKSLLAHRSSMETVGHNIANATREGYSRQRVLLKAEEPLYAPSLTRAQSPGQIGQGVRVQAIERIRDELLDTQIVAQKDEVGYWQTRDRYIRMLEQNKKEVGDESVRLRLDSFWQAWQDLAANPSDRAHREVIIERGASVAESIRLDHRRLMDVHRLIHDDLSVTVEELNTHIRQIAQLNQAISRSQALGDNPNDLMDERDILVEKLGLLTNITVENRRDPDEFQIHSEGVHLVQGSVARTLNLNAEPGPYEVGHWRITWSGNDQDFLAQGGKLGALMQLRDEDLSEEIQNTNSLAINLASAVNDVHRQAYGLDGLAGRNFFTQRYQLTSTEGNYDRNEDGVFDSTLVFQIRGTQKLEPFETISFAGTMTLSSPEGNINIAYAETDTIIDIINRINNSGSDIRARLNAAGELELKGTARRNTDGFDFVIRHIEDSGPFLTSFAGILAANGPAGAYDWETVNATGALAEAPEGIPRYSIAPLPQAGAWLEVSAEITADHSKIATGFGSNGQAAAIGDNTAAQAIASLHNSPTQIGPYSSFDDFFAATSARIGAKGQEAQIALETHRLINQDLLSLRDSISGVNMDEELSYMLQFQHGFMATSRFISAFNEMLDTLINRIGV